MRPEFYDLYRDLNELYRLSQYELHSKVDRESLVHVRGLRIIDDVITETVSDLDLSLRLRPDARLFLLVNCHQMVLLPLAYAERVITEPLPVEQILRHDVRTILASASEMARGEEISGHAVIDAVSRVWRQLRATQLNVWG